MSVEALLAIEAYRASITLDRFTERLRRHIEELGTFGTASIIVTEHETFRLIDMTAGLRPLPTPAPPARVVPEFPATAYAALLK